MKKFFLKIGFGIMKRMSFKTLEKLTKKSGMKLTEQNYLMMKNMMFI